MYTYRNCMPVSRTFDADTRLELLLRAGLDGVLGCSWEDVNGAVLATGFFTYLIGKPTPGEELDRILETACPYCVIPKSIEWKEYIERYRSASYTRYKMRPPIQFDSEFLQSNVLSPDREFQILPITHCLRNRKLITDEELNIPHVYGCFERYMQHGFGFAAILGNTAASVVSSYIVHNGEAEVDIATRPEFRRRGLASAVCSAFILECIRRGLTPSWDAQNPESVRLAEKLGFTLDHPYEAIILKF